MNLIVLGVIFLSLRIGRNDDRNEKMDLDGHQLDLRNVGVGVALRDARERGAEVEIEIGISI